MLYRRRLILVACSIVAAVTSTAIALTHAHAIPLGRFYFSHWADVAPHLDGEGTVGEWDRAARFSLPHGVLMVQNDEENLYVLLDMTGDTVNDTPKRDAPWGDYYWLSFDINRDHNVTPGVDVNYAPVFVPGLRITRPILYPILRPDYVPPIVDVSKILVNPVIPLPPPPPIIKPILLPGPILPQQISQDILIPPTLQLADTIRPVPRVTLPALNLRDTTRITIQHFLGLCEWTPVQETDSREVTGFGPSLNSATPHRQFEFALKLAEINADPSTWDTFRDRPFVRLGLRASSQTPAFQDNVPDGFCGDFGDLISVFLATRPTSGPGLGLGRWFRGIGLIPMQKINQTTGLATTDPGYYLSVKDAPFGGTLQIFGNWAFLRSRGAIKYRVVHRHNSGGGWSAWTPIIQSFGNYHLDPDGELRLKTIAPTTPDGWVNVPLFGDDSNWYLRDILSEWTSGQDGMEQFKVEIQRWIPLVGVVTTSPADPDDSLTIRIVNTRPIVQLTVKHAGAVVGPCAVETLAASPDGFILDAYIHDNNNNLQSWVVWASGPLGESDTTCSAPAVVGGADDYGSHAGAGGWAGPGDITLPTSTPWRATCSGCYEFHIGAHGRTTNGYSHTLWTYPDPIPVKVIVP